MPTDSVFSGLKVLDTASFIAGPAAATMLAEFGAEVIKIEPPGHGDTQRILGSLPPNPHADANYSWHMANRNKRGVAIDLKSAGGKRDPHAPRRVGRRGDHERPASHARGAPPRLRRGLALEPAGHLCRRHRLRRRRPGRRAAGLRSHCLLVAQRAAGVDARRRRSADAADRRERRLRDRGRSLRGDRDRASTTASAPARARASGRRCSPRACGPRRRSSPARSPAARSTGSTTGRRRRTRCGIPTGPPTTAGSCSSPSPRNGRASRSWSGIPSCSRTRALRIRRAWRRTPRR